MDAVRVKQANTSVFHHYHEINIERRPVIAVLIRHGKESCIAVSIFEPPQNSVSRLFQEINKRFFRLLAFVRKERLHYGFLHFCINISIAKSNTLRHFPHIFNNLFLSLFRCRNISAFCAIYNRLKMRPECYPPSVRQARGQ